MDAPRRGEESNGMPWHGLPAVERIDNLVWLLGQEWMLGVEVQRAQLQTIEYEPVTGLQPQEAQDAIIKYSLLGSHLPVSFLIYPDVPRETVVGSNTMCTPFSRSFLYRRRDPVLSFSLSLSLSLSFNALVICLRADATAMLWKRWVG
ncbi:hypothetical protein K474DRAFT_919712 [Panus rudis PR-1116 ss-1]|nr:hypothetical protein K474DRAFT_919712 [Panus rudis PR-1116 ss-1]